MVNHINANKVKSTKLTFRTTKLLFKYNSNEDMPYKFNGKEFDRMHGLDWYDYGARNYDAQLCQWDRMDRKSEKYYNVSPYSYCMNSPLLMTDPNGDTIRLEDKKDMNFFKNSFNSQSQGFYGFNKKGDLYLIKNTNTKGFSKTYKKRLLKAIKSEKIIYLKKADKFTNGGNEENVSNYGEGVTLSNKNEAHIIVSGKEHTVKDKDGKDLVQTAADIIMHEFNAHAGPQIAPISEDTGNGILDENGVRRERGVKERMEDDNHVE